MPDRVGARTPLETLLGAIRRIAGMPDYGAHLEHLRHCHPGARPPTEREFFEQYLRARYGDGPTRCC
ncbi:MAG: CstA-like transporter-associated (seleno)protein [Gemmatimonadales bacterium]